MILNRVDMMSSDIDVDEVVTTIWQQEYVEVVDKYVNSVDIVDNVDNVVEHKLQIDDVYVEVEVRVCLHHKYDQIMW